MYVIVLYPPACILHSLRPLMPIFYDVTIQMQAETNHRNADEMAKCKQKDGFQVF